MGNAFLSQLQHHPPEDVPRAHVVEDGVDLLQRRFLDLGGDQACERIGRGHRLLMLERFIKDLQSHDGVRFSTMGDFVQRWKAEHPFAEVAPQRKLS